MSHCNRFQDWLHDYFLDRLPPAERGWMDSHAALCTACGALMDLALELSCREFVECLNDYLEDRLAGERRAVFERHISICADCQGYLSTYRETMAATALSCRGLVPPGVPAGLVRAILAAREASGGPEPPADDGELGAPQGDDRGGGREDREGQTE